MLELTIKDKLTLIVGKLGFKKYLPVRRGFTIDIVVPVTHAVFLVKTGFISAHVRDPSAIFITQVEYLR